MLGFNPISSLPISTIPSLFVPASAGGVPNYQYPGEVDVYARDGINALFDTDGRAENRRKRLAEARRALGLVPAVEPIVVPQPPAEALPEAVSYATVLADEQARQDALKAADAVIAEMRTAVALGARQARIDADDADVLMMITELV